MEDIQKFSPVYIEGLIWDEGSIWDEGGNTEIVQILISHDDNYIKAIQFVYAVNGKLLRSEIHGEVTDENKFAAVGFEYPTEYLVSVSGWHECSNRTLASITFGTNKRTYGPFGSADSLYLAFKFAYYFSPKSCFGGFHGSVSKGRLFSIGVYIKPAGSLVDFMTSS